MATLSRLPSNLKPIHDHSDDPDQIAHAALPRSKVPQLPPVLSKEIDEHPLSWLGFEADCIMTACSKGHIRTWDRPKDDATETVFANPFQTR